MYRFGRIYQTTIFGESHGESIGISIDGCPSGIPLNTDHFDKDLERRKSGAKGTTPRKESDQPKIVSGVYRNKTTGAPITILFENENTQSKDYDHLLKTPRPGHADYVARQKFGSHNDHRGGGHFSGRLTLGLVASGVIAKQIISPLEVQAKLIEAGGIQNIEEAIERAIKADDSIGGIVECKVRNMPVGLGEPFFDSIESLISHAVFSIPAIKGIEFGAGFNAAKLSGSQNNDNLLDLSGKTETNNAGGVNGGLSNGNDLVFRVAVKPTSSTQKPQKTLNTETGKIEELKIGGRHDLCIALRVPVVVEAVTAMVLTDFMLLEQKRNRVF